MKNVTGQAKITKGQIEILDKDSLDTFKKSRRDGDRLRFIFETWQDKRSEEAHRYFHVLRDSYAAAQFITKPYAKIELKYLWGIYLQYSNDFIPPLWPGRFAQYPAGGSTARIYFFKSILVYTVKEMNLIIEGTIKSCIDVGADIEELMQDYKERQNGNDRKRKK